MIKPVIELDDVCKVYQGHHVVEGIQLNILKGEIVGLLGLNGSGKSTTIKMLLGLVSPSSGQIRYFGQEFKKNQWSLLKRIGCLIEPPGYYEHLSVYDNLKMISNIVGFYRKNSIDALLDSVGIGHLKQVKVKKLSHSDRQLLAIARALMNSPEILILDEPLNGLEQQAFSHMKTLLKRLAKERDTTIVISSHVISEIESLADRIGVLHEGRLVQIIEKNEMDAFEQQRYILHTKSLKIATECLRGASFNYQVLSRNFISIATEKPIKVLFELFIKNQVEILELYPQYQSLDDKFSELISLANRGMYE